MRGIEQRLRRLERRRAHEECDPREANRLAVQCYDAGLPLPDTLTREERAIAEAILSTLSFYDNMWSDLPLPLEALPER